MRSPPVKVVLGLRGYIRLGYFFSMIRILLQRVSSASVSVDGTCVADMSQGGLLALVGLGQEDLERFTTPEVCRLEWAKVWQKIAKLRVFSDAEGKMNLSLLQMAASQGDTVVPQDSKALLPKGLLIVSQFTLYADCVQGNRPSFTASMPSAEAFERFTQGVEVAKTTLPTIPIYQGVFGANMQIALVNDGPVTLMLS